LKEDTSTSTDREPAYYHQPVMLAETVALLRPAPGRVIYDGTLGGGGHTEALLKAGATVIASDRDPAALRAAGPRLAQFGNRVRLLELNFVQAAHRLPELSLSPLDGVLLDLGVSSHQLDIAERGFSLLRDGPLDMRMTPHPDEPTAADIVNQATEEELSRIFFELGEEKQARRVAAHLVQSRTQQRFSTTSELARAVEKVIPKRGPRHPATRIFQALRLAVNRELENLEQALPGLSSLLRSAGRFVIITFHSLEDRIVKRYFRSVTRRWLDRPEWPEPRPNPDCLFRLLTSHPLEPGAEEVRTNPRSRSAKLRAIERIEV
jgi:16S rRNA (cytosine1402-N4)-methyltransferase